MLVDQASAGQTDVVLVIKGVGERALVVVKTEDREWNVKDSIECVDYSGAIKESRKTTRLAFGMASDSIQKDPVVPLGGRIIDGADITQNRQCSQNSRITRANHLSTSKLIGQAQHVAGERFVTVK